MCVQEIIVQLYNYLLFVNNLVINAYLKRISSFNIRGIVYYENVYHYFYFSGQEIPRVHYTDQEIKTW